MKPYFKYPSASIPVQIEAKLKIANRDEVLAALKAAGAQPVSETLDVDSFYDTEDRELLAQDEGLRLRVSTDLATGQQSVALTHKGPQRYGQNKTRDRAGLKVASADEAALLLERLGFILCLSFERRRSTWMLEGCRVEVTDVPCLGSFVEITGASEQLVSAVREKLSLAERPLIKASYVAMLMCWMQERGEMRTNVEFPAETRAGRIADEQMVAP